MNGMKNPAYDDKIYTAAYYAVGEIKRGDDKFKEEWCSPACLTYEDAEFLGGDWLESQVAEQSNFLDSWDWRFRVEKLFVRKD